MSGVGIAILPFKSVSLDLIIMTRTVQTVIHRRGYY
jgi:hypothetical protein